MANHIEMEYLDTGDGPPHVGRHLSHTTSYNSARNTQRPQFKRSISQSVKSSVADFFGVGEDNPVEQMKWRQRSMNLSNNPLMKCKMKDISPATTVDSVFGDSLYGSSGPPSAVPARALPYDPFARPHRQMSRLSQGSSIYARQYSRQLSTTSSGRRSSRLQPGRRSRKDSVAKMAYDGVKNIVVPSTRRKQSYRHSRSFTANSITSYVDEPVQVPYTKSSDSEDALCEDVFFNLAIPTSPPVDMYIGSAPPLIYPGSSYGGASAPIQVGDELPAIWEQRDTPRTIEELEEEDVVDLDPPQSSIHLLDSNSVHVAIDANQNRDKRPPLTRLQLGPSGDATAKKKKVPTASLR